MIEKFSILDLFFSSDTDGFSLSCDLLNTPCTQILLDNSEPCCTDTAYGYIDPLDSNHVVYICPALLDLPVGPWGADATQGSALISLVGQFADLADYYENEDTTAAAQVLAEEDPFSAIQNSQNLAYFVGSRPQFCSSASSFIVSIFGIAFIAIGFILF